MKRSVIQLAIVSVLILTLVSCKDKKDDKPTSLDNWIGTYTVTAESYYGDSQVPPVDVDETWTVTVSVVDTNDLMLRYEGIGSADATEVFATLDPDLLTVAFKSGQSLGDIHSYGDTKIYFATSDIIAKINSDIVQALVDAAGEINITGTIDNNGGMLIDKFGIVHEGPFVYDVFKTTWVKQ